MNNETPKRWGTFEKVICIVGIVMAVFIAVVTTEQENCHKAGPVVTGIKQASSSSGFLSSGSVCIYETDEGDVSYPCGYKTGDVVSGTVVCQKTGNSIAQNWREN